MRHGMRIARSRWMRSSRFRALLAALAVCAGIAACGKDSPSSPSPSPTPGTNCSFTVGDGPASAVAAAGMEFTVAVATAANCTWNASSTVGFITPLSQTNGTGNGSVRFSVQSNSGASRQGSVVVANRTIDVRQEGAAACAFNVSPTEVPVPAGGGDFSIAVSAASGPNCTWTATSNSTFVTVKEGASGTGDGTVVLAVSANTGDARVGTAAVAGHTVSLLQDGTAPQACDWTLTPARIDAPASGLTGAFITITKTQGGTCPWLARSGASWLTIRPPASGEGSGSITVDVAENLTASSRGAEINLTNSPNGPKMVVSQAAYSPAAPVAVLSFQSDPDDYIGQGQSRTFTLTGSEFTATIDSAMSELQFRMTGAPFWNLTLETASSQPLTPGLYNLAARWPFQPAGAPGLTFAGDGRGCNRLTGRFLVATAQFSGPFVQRFHARFEQHCEGWSAALRGEIWIDAFGTSPPPLASFPPPPSTPTTMFSYVSDPGDFVGGGQTGSYSLSGMNVLGWQAGNGSVVNIRFRSASAPPTVSWNLDFAATSGSPLLPGSYTGAARYPFNSGVPGLNVDGNGRGCNTLTGSFVVLEATFGPQGEVLRFHATFEQHCEGAVPALRGEIRIAADPWR